LSRNLALYFLAIELTLALLVFSRMANTQAYQPPTPTQVPSGIPVSEWATAMMPTEDCSLPCWWGIHPNETRTDKIASISSVRFEGIKGRQFIERDTERDTFLFQNFIGTVDESQASIPVVALLIHVKDGMVEDIWATSPAGATVGTAFAPAWDYFSVENAPRNLGIPDSIRIVGHQSSDGLRAHYLMFIWRELGTLIEYRILYPQAAGGTPQPHTPICFNTSELEYIGVRMQSPTSERTLEELAQEGMSGGKDISVVTDFTPEEFIQILEANEGCLPSDLPIFWDRTATPTPVPSPTAD
jgi:hypothetical protein